MNKKEFFELIKKQIVILDGATGTQLSLQGMPKGACPEEWVLENPEALQEVQSNYKDAGSNIIYTSTFGGNRYKLEEFNLEDKLYEINKEIAIIAKKAAGENCLVFGDLAPTGKFIKPFGDVEFEDAVNIYKEQVKALIDGGVDGFVIETMLDIQEARAALIAVNEITDMPVMVSMTFGEDGRTLNGTDPVSALVTLQSLGADAVGCNCSTGPADMINVIKKMKKYATVPLLAKPNAGMPRLIDGKTVFDMRPEEYSSYVDEFIEAGVNILGGCCGTTPKHIKEVALKAKGKKGKLPEVDSVSAVSSSRKTCFLGSKEPFVVVGERINPTGKKAFQAELRNNKTSMIKQFAIEQKTNGANILDVNMGLSGIDEKEMMLKAINILSPISDLPLCIDTTKPEIVEAALRLYPGRAIVNSISAEKDRIEKTLPIAAKYGAMFILLPLTDDGIPKTVEERKDVVLNVVKEAEKYGYKLNDIAVDGLVMTISSDQQAAGVTLDLIDWCSNELGVNTICGLSNVSFGLPERLWANTAFLTMAISRGLTMAIANPSSELIMNMITACDAISARDKKLKRYIDKFSNIEKNVSESKIVKALDVKEIVYNAVLQGDEDNIAEYIENAIKEEIKPKDLIDNYLIPAINKVGEKFDKKEYFLPQLIMSADAMRKGFETLEPYLKEDSNNEIKKGPTVIIATVQGDIHDIGKNIVALMLKNYNFNVIDLGKDVSAIDIINSAKKHNAEVIALSALMTTTMVEMKDVILTAKQEGLKKVKFMIGGAVVDQNYADEIGADGYSSDAMGAVHLAKELTK